MNTERKKLSEEINNYLEKVRHLQGWTIDDLANYLEIGSLTVRNALYKKQWSDMAVTILKLKNVIPEKLAYDYKKALEREKIEERKKEFKSKKLEVGSFGPIKLEKIK